MAVTLGWIYLDGLRWERRGYGELVGRGGDARASDGTEGKESGQEVRGLIRGHDARPSPDGLSLGGSALVHWSVGGHHEISEKTECIFARENRPGQWASPNIERAC